jgi:hypothetical protein
MRGILVAGEEVQRAGFRRLASGRQGRLHSQMMQEDEEPMRIKSIAMSGVAAGALAVALFAATEPQPAHAQQACYEVYQACGTRPGYFRPQPVCRTPGQPWLPTSNCAGQYYAPVGNGQYWVQARGSNNYRPERVEVNPFHPRTSFPGYLGNRNFYVHKYHTATEQVRQRTQPSPYTGPYRYPQPGPAPVYRR